MSLMRRDVRDDIYLVTLGFLSISIWQYIQECIPILLKLCRLYELFCVEVLK